MPHRGKSGLRVAVAGMTGMMLAGSALTPLAQAQGGQLKSEEECDGAAIPIPNLIEARKSGNESSAGPKALKQRTKKKAAKKKAATKKVARKKTMKKAAKKAARKQPGRLKARAKAAPRRRTDKSPC